MLTTNGEVIGLESSPRRQGMPFLLIPSLLLWAGAAISFLSSANAPSTLLIPLLVTSAILALVCAALMFIAPSKDLALSCAMVFVGVALGLVASGQLQEGYASAEEHKAVIRLSVLRDSTSTDHGHSTVCEALCEDGTHLKVRLFTKDDECFLTGTQLVTDSHLSPLPAETEGYLRDQGICAQMNGDDLTRKDPVGWLGVLREVRTRALEVIDQRSSQSNLLSALVCGYRPPLAESDLNDDFKACGLAHLVAVSGAHTSIILMMLSLLLKALRLPRIASLLIAVGFVGAYLILAGMPISAIRSAVMAILSLTSTLAHRRNASLNALALCIIGFMVTDPISCLSVSLFLSAASTLGIILFCSLFTSWIPQANKRVRSLIVEPAAMTLAANVMTLPASAALFSQISLISPLANIAAAPLFTIACALGFAGCFVSVLCEPLSAMAMSAADLAVYPLKALVECLGSVPFASIPCSLPLVPMILLSFICAGVLWIWWPRPSKRLLETACAMAALLIFGSMVFARVPSVDSIVMLDVGQGDAILVRSKTQAILIDTGNSDAKLRRELGAHGVYELDAVIITHPDDDHCASLASLGSYVNVRRILWSEGIFTCGCEKCSRLLQWAERCSPHAERVGLQVQDVVDMGSIRLEVIWPDSFVDEGGNADSLCLRADIDVNEDGSVDWKALLVGDAEAEQIAAMIAEGRVGDVDVFKVGHHGSKVCLSEETLNAIRPEVALISVGAGNRYGHPSAEAINLLGSVECNVLRSDELGSVTVAFSLDRLDIRRQ